MLRGYLDVIPWTSSNSGRTWHPDVEVDVRYCIDTGKQPSRHCPSAWALGERQTLLGVKDQHIMNCYTGTQTWMNWLPKSVHWKIEVRFGPWDIWSLGIVHLIKNSCTRIERNRVLMGKPGGNRPFRKWGIDRWIRLKITIKTQGSCGLDSYGWG